MGSVSEKKVALITGGASGMGLAVATALTHRGNWNVHLLDMNEANGKKATSELGDASTFHRVNVTSYQELAGTFDKIFNAEGRLDFVFANAGIVERYNFFEQHVTKGPPPEPDLLVVDINLKAVYTTSYLALHYQRLSPGDDKSLVMTASCGGIYPAEGSSCYSGTKHGVVGFMRSIARKYQQSGIRVNCICPGTVATGLLEQAAWLTFPQEAMTPVSTVVNTVTKFIDGGEMTDAWGNTVAAGKVFGQAAELSVNNFYFRNAPAFADDAMALTMGSTQRDNIVKAS